MVSLLDRDGRELAAVGLAAPAPAEYRDPSLADLDLLEATATVAARSDGPRTRPWLAALAVGLLLAAAAPRR